MTRCHELLSICKVWDDARCNIGLCSHLYQNRFNYKKGVGGGGGVLLSKSQ